MHSFKEQKIDSIKIGKSKHLKMAKCSFASIQRALSQITVEPVLFLYMLSTFSLYALFQDLVYTKVCILHYDAEICDNNHLYDPDNKEKLDVVQQLSSHYILLSTVSLTVPSILMSIYIGSWSDRFGRKWPVAIPPLGGVFASLIYIIIAFDQRAHVAFICLASFLSGICGGFACCILGCMSYVATVSDEENRTTRLSRLEGMLFLGGTIGPFISGSMLEVTGHGYAFFFMMICYALAFLYAIFFVRDIRDLEPNSNKLVPVPNGNGNLEAEQKSGLLDGTDGHKASPLGQNGISKSPSARAKSKKKIKYSPSLDEGQSYVDDERNVIVPRNRRDSDKEGEEDQGWFCTYFGSQHFTDALRTAFVKREGNRRTQILLVLLIMIIVMMTTAGELDVSYLYAKDKLLRWDYKTYSYYFGIKYGIGALVLLLGMPILQRYKWEDTSICVLGLLSRIAGLILYGLSTSTVMAFSAPILAIFSFYTLPATRSLLSKLVRPSEQGKMFAFVAIVEDLCTMSASVLFNSIYPLTRDFFPGFIFMLAAALLVIPIIIMWFIRRSVRESETLFVSNEENPISRPEDNGIH